MHAAPRHQKLTCIQWLRALAASGVVFLHAQMTAERFSGAPPFVSSTAAEFGQYGVDLFFVISGFVIYYTNFPQPLPAGRFFARRAWRIVPLYGLLTLLAFGLRRVVPDSAFASPSPTLSDLILSVTFLSGHRPIIGAGWTLEFEMFFYGCTALAIAVLGGRWSLVAYALIAFALCGRFVPSVAGPLALLMDPLLLEFVFGLVVAEIFCSGRVPRLKVAVLVAASVLAWGQSQAVIWAGLPSALLVYGAARFSASMPTNLVTRVCTALGDASYSIYLIQFFTLPVIGRVVQLAFEGRTPNLLLATGFLGTLLAGYACYVWVERPLQRWRSPKRSPG